MWFDIVCVVLLLTAVVNGYRKGVLSQLGAVVGVVAGILFCNLYAGRLADYFAGENPGAMTRMLDNAMAYVLIFTICYVIGRFFGKTLAHSMRALSIGFIDRLAGSIFCVLEYFLVFSILLNAWIAIFPDTKLRTNYTRVKTLVIDFGPAVLGSSTVSELYGSVENAVNRIPINDVSKKTLSDDTTRQ